MYFPPPNITNFIENNYQKLLHRSSFDNSRVNYFLTVAVKARYFVPIQLVG